MSHPELESLVLLVLTQLKLKTHSSILDLFEYHCLWTLDVKDIQCFTRWWFTWMLFSC